MKYEQKGHGKPYMKSLDEIEEQTQELKQYCRFPIKSNKAIRVV